MEITHTKKTIYQNGKNIYENTIKNYDKVIGKIKGNLMYIIDENKKNLLDTELLISYLSSGVDVDNYESIEKFINNNIDIQNLIKNADKLNQRLQGRTDAEFFWNGEFINEEKERYNELSIAWMVWYIFTMLTEYTPDYTELPKISEEEVRTFINNSNYYSMVKETS
jgi:regulator of replication initiation timing